MFLKDLKEISENINLDSYIEFRELVKQNMPHPEWLGDFSKEDLEELLNNKSKIWIYYLGEEPVCSMMLIPSTEKTLKKFDINLDSNIVVDYGPMFVNPKYVGNKLQYQMLKEIDKYSLSLGYKYAAGTIHPENIYSINNLLKDNFELTGTKEFTRGIRNIYLKKLSYDISFRKMKDSDDEYKMLHKWCSNKNVYEWFEQRVLSFDEIKNKYKNKLNKQDLFIIRCDDNDIGLIQIYKFENDIDLDLNNYKNVYEYDIYIGEEDYLSKGIGTEIIKLVNKKIFNEYKSDAIILRPFKRNIRAIKCYQKNNFKIISEYLGKDTLGNDEEIVVLLNTVEIDK